MKRKRGPEEEEKKVKMENRGNEEKVENRRKEEKVEDQGNIEEDDLAELDKFVISAMLAGVPFLKAKIKTFAKKKESRMKEKVEELGTELALKKRQLVEFDWKNRELGQKLARVCDDFKNENSIVNT